MARDVSGEHEIVNELGLHARAASKLVGLANKFDAECFVGWQGREVNAKSILGVLMLAAGKGARITVRCEGRQAQEAYDALGNLIREGFGEL